MVQCHGKVTRYNFINFLILNQIIWNNLVLSLQSSGMVHGGKNFPNYSGMGSQDYSFVWE